MKNWEFIIGAFVPVLVTFSTSSIVGFNIFPNVSMADFLQIVSALGGVLLVIITKQIELHDHYKFWKDYRANAEQLRHELMLYKTGAEPYHDKGAYLRLVRNVEDLLNQENMRWIQHNHLEQDAEGED